MCVITPLNTIGLLFDLAGAILIGGYAFRVLSYKHLTGQTGERIANWPASLWSDGFNPDTAGVLLDIAGGTLMLAIGFVLQTCSSLTGKHVCQSYFSSVLFALTFLVCFYFKKRRWLVFWRAGKTEDYDG